jgi:hypothetical protein
VPAGGAAGEAGGGATLVFSGGACGDWGFQLILVAFHCLPSWSFHFSSKINKNFPTKNFCFSAAIVTRDHGNQFQ